jgi:hypothetical protein
MTAQVVIKEKGGAPFPTRNDLPLAVRRSMVDLLDARLADAVEQIATDTTAQATKLIIVRSTFLTGIPPVDVCIGGPCRPPPWVVMPQLLPV